LRNVTGTPGVVKVDDVIDFIPGIDGEKPEILVRDESVIVKPGTR